MNTSTEDGIPQETHRGDENGEKESHSHEPVVPRPAEPQQAQHRRPVYGVQEYTPPFPHQVHPPPEEEQCCICEGNMQDIDIFFPEVREILKKLTPELKEDLIDVVNELEILNANRFNPMQANFSSDIVNDFIRFLQRFCLTGRKCALCLLDYCLQRIDCFELAYEIKYLPYMGFQQASPSLS